MKRSLSWGFYGVIILMLMGIAVPMSEANTAPDKPDILAARSHRGPSVENGVFAVSMLKEGQWIEMGTVGFGKFISENQLKLREPPAEGTVQIRLTHSGHTAAHIDTVRLGVAVPSLVVGVEESESLALKKLKARDYDVIDGKSKTLELTFESIPATTDTLVIAARIEPDRIGENPFFFSHGS